MPASEPWNAGHDVAREQLVAAQDLSRGAQSLAVTSRRPKPPERSWSRSMAAMASSGVPTTQLAGLDHLVDDRLARARAPGAAGP